MGNIKIPEEVTLDRETMDRLFEQAKSPRTGHIMPSRLAYLVSKAKAEIRKKIINGGGTSNGETDNKGQL